MGCAKSSNVDEGEGTQNRLRKPKPWRHGDRTLSSTELREMRKLFWNNAPSRYGGKAEIWEALEEVAACDDLYYAQKILDIHAITLGNPDMTLCFDNAGNRYELPLFVLSEPTNMDYRRTNILDRFRRK